jgi:3-deoxy-D-manno-octulosonate 8-phosphate phosphatase (KDO 8-P phosphatase)
MKPVQQFTPELLLRAQDIQLLILDVDGVLTDGNLYYGPEGEVLKVFNSLDGHGLKLLAAAKVTVAIITGRKSEMVARRAAELGVKELHQGVEDKLAVAQALLKKLKLDWPQVAMMGDDWPDLALITRAGFAACPSNAHVELKSLCHLSSAKQGGQGAVREICDLLLTAKGIYSKEFTTACGHNTLA